MSTINDKLYIIADFLVLNKKDFEMQWGSYYKTMKRLYMICYDVDKLEGLEVNKNHSSTYEHTVNDLMRQKKFSSGVIMKKLGLSDSINIYSQMVILWYCVGAGKILSITEIKDLTQTNTANARLLHRILRALAVYKAGEDVDKFEMTKATYLLMMEKVRGKTDKSESKH